MVKSGGIVVGDVSCPLFDISGSKAGVSLWRTAQNRSGLLLQPKHFLHALLVSHQHLAMPQKPVSYGKLFGDVVHALSISFNYAGSSKCPRQLN